MQLSEDFLGPFVQRLLSQSVEPGTGIFSVHSGNGFFNNIRHGLSQYAIFTDITIFVNNFYNFYHIITFIFGEK